MLDLVNLPRSDHFYLEQLADGVYAAIARDSGAAISNSGIIDLGDRSLVFDSFLTPWAGEDLRRIAELLTKRPVDTLINSHYHNDHIRGNQSFPRQTEIIATVKTESLMRSKGTQELNWDLENALSKLTTLEKRLHQEKNDTRRRELGFWITYYRVIVESLPTLALRFPNQTFDTEVVYHGSRRTARLISYGAGHTPDDAFLYLPEDGIAFLGDLLFIRCHPYVADGNLAAWLDYLKKIEALELKIVVPGHGPIGSQADIHQLEKYLDILDATVKQVIEDKGTLEQVSRQPIPDEFMGWRFPDFYSENLCSLFEHLNMSEEL
jgi:cyclase